MDESSRLFVCTYSTGEFEVHEIQHHTQSDLQEDIVAILDTPSKV